MNAKRVITTGLLALVSFGPLVASAQEGPYFNLFYGVGQYDADQDDLNAIASSLIQTVGSNAPSGTSDINDQDSMWGVQIGYRFNKWVAAEIGYVDLGKYNYTAQLTSTFTANPDIPDGTYTYQSSARYLSSGPTIAAVGLFPIGERFDVYGRAGLLFAETRFRVKYDIGPGYSLENDAGTQEYFVGGGFAWNFSEDYNVRTDATYFLDLGDDDRTTESSVFMLTLGIGFR